MKKIWILIILYSFLFVSGGFFTPIGYVANNSTVSNIGVISIVVAFFFCLINTFPCYETPGPISKTLFRILHVEIIRKNARVWLIFHKAIQIMEIIAIALFFSGFIITGTLAKPGSIVVVYCFTWFLLFSTLVFPYFHVIRNLLGMGYDEMEGASIYGVRAFAQLSSKLLNNRNKRGIRYLSIALRMLGRSLKARKLSLTNIQETLVMLRVINQMENEIEYEPLLDLSDGLSQQPLLPHASDILEKFVNNKRLAWARRFHKFEGQRQSWVKALTIAATLITAVGTVIQAILPESQKTYILNLVSQFLSSPSVILLFPIVVLSYVLKHYAQRIENTTVKWGDIKKMKKTNETKEHALSTISLF